MTSVTILNIDEALAQRLAARGRTAEAEAKDILSTALGGGMSERVPDNSHPMHLWC